MPSLEQELDALIRSHGLSRAQELIRARTKPSARLVPASEGSSRFGGDFALLPVSDWPTSHGSPLQLLAQIDLSHLPSNIGELPNSGFLSFFYDAENMPDYSDGDRSGWAVIYTPDPAATSRLASPVPAFPAKTFRLVEDVTIPTMRSIDMTEMDLSADEREQYWQLMDAVLGLAAPGEQRVHRVFGHPDGIQGCMQRTLQFETRGLKLPQGVYSWYEHPRAAELMPGAHDWRLLLQVDSDPDEFGTYWGDDGRLYFWIHRDDLAARRFERTWLAFQCH